MSVIERLLDKKAVVVSILVAVFIGGILSYMALGKLEDAEIPVKSAMIITPYPGASAHEVELEVTDVMEKAVQQLENVKEIRSRSLPGLSEITVDITETTKTDELPQLWDHLRRKINDAKKSLPHGAMEPVVYDDYGDVYGIFLAISSDGYSYDELKNYVDYMRRELLSVDGVRRIDLFGLQTETIDLTFSENKFAELGINPMLIVQALGDQVAIVNSGSVVTGSERIRLAVGNKYASIAEIENLIVENPLGGNFRLGDVATVSRSFMEPRTEGLYYNGKPAISMALSMEKGVNVINIGEAFDKKIDELKAEIPVGIEVNKVFYQPDRVQASINNFMINLAESVLIVMVVLLFTMGFRSGLLISSGLVLTILGTFIVMNVMGVQLHRVSLAAIIVAMGMLVDNAIVVADGILVDLQHGKKRNKAFIRTANQTALPLLGATLVAILAFLPLALSPNGAGEYMSSLFTVLSISLFLSWIFAMVQTPFMARFFYRKGIKKKLSHDDPYDSVMYRGVKKGLNYVLGHKYYFLTGSAVILLISFYSFRYVNMLFMPTLDYNQFVVEYYLPEGADIECVDADLTDIQAEILQWDGVEQITMALGRTPSRYNLLRPMNGQNQNYGELIVDATDYETSLRVGARIETLISTQYPQGRSRVRRYGPVFSEYGVEVLFKGPDPRVLRELTEQAKQIMNESEITTAVTDNWHNKVKVISPVYSAKKARKLQISRKDLAQSLAIATGGLPVGVFYDGNRDLPILLKTEGNANNDPASLNNVPVWGSRSSSIPLAQTIDTLDLEWQDQIVRRVDGERGMRAQCDPIIGYTANQVVADIQDKMNALEIPDGYTMVWEGETADSAEANKAIFTYLPLAVGLMVLIIIMLFNNFKQPIIIFSVVPLAFVGIIIGFLTTRAYFNFMAIIGALGLIGMMIKNAVVLIDQINLEVHEGKTHLDAIIDSTISRVRPVVMASATTILGMFPLLFDIMFSSMAITVMFGLLVGTLITLLVVPALYAVFYKVDTKSLLGN